FIKSDKYISVKNGLHYFWNTFKYSLKGYVIHNHINGDSPKGFILCLVAQFCGLIFGRRKVALTFHAGPIQKYFPQIKEPKLTFMYKILFGIPKVIICNNEAVKKNIAGYNVPAEKIYPIQGFTRQYIEFDRVQLDPEIEKFYSDHEFVIFSTAFFRPEYYLDILLNAVKIVIDMNKTVGLFLAVSKMYEENYDDIIQLVDKLDIKDNLKIVYELDHNTFLTCLTKSKIYVRTPVKDGVASSILESLSLGIPVIASENGTRPQSVVTYKNNDKDLFLVLRNIIDNYSSYVQKIVKPELPDTIEYEIAVLKSVD
ncbi:MAG: glycosyltransferase, partial [Promethearchaeota archaeon]